MPSPEPADARGARLGSAERALLLDVARASIAHGLLTGRPLEVDPREHPETLFVPGASFVTLRRNGELRGCTGSLEATRPLVADVAANAFGSAFRDPRFSPLADWEEPELELRLSVLSAPEPLPATSEEELYRFLRPGIDGLILEVSGRRATFLPEVWKSLVHPRDFVAELRRKAGLPPDGAHGALRFARYTVESFP